MISTLKYRSSERLRVAGILSMACLVCNSQANNELQSMSLEKLMNMDIEIVSASKTSQKASDSAAAIFVISEEDIERSGAIHIPDVLRMVPGMFVGKNSSSEWSVGPRGYAQTFGGETLVLIDGRSVFSSLQNNMNWQEQNIHVNDIERIEVIRGPGGSLWGSNAVNGVINIITKSAKDSQTTQFSALGGEGDKGSFYASHGFAFGEQGYVKFSAHQTEKEGYEGKRSGIKEQDWESYRLAFDAQWEDDIYSFGLSGNHQKITSNPYWPQYTLTAPYLSLNDPEEDRDGYAIQAKFGLALSEKSTLNTRLSLDDIETDSLNFKSASRNLDLDIEWTYKFDNGHLLSSGINTRSSTDFYESFELLDIDVLEPEIDTNINSIFAQYTHAVTDNIRLTAGVKVEDHSEVGKTTQPTLQALWIANEQHRFWASLSKSNATPSRLEYSPASVRVITFPPGAVDPTVPLATEIRFINDGSKTDAQELISNQIGWRFSPTSKVNIDVTAFYNEYENRGVTNPEVENEVLFGAAGPYLQIRTFPANDGKSKTHGLELAATWVVIDNWKLKYAGTSLNVDDSQAEAGIVLVEGSNITRTQSDHWHSLRSLYDVTDSLQFDVWLRHTDAITNEPDLESYSTLDLRLAWQASELFNVSFAARNFGSGKHIEYNREAFLADRFYVEDTYSLEIDVKF